MRIAVVLLTAGLAGCVSDAAPMAKVAPPVISSFREITPPERKMLVAIFAKALKDPDSARWEWAPIRSDIKTGFVVYCGRVNAKNSYGGYVGSRVYVATITVEKGAVTDAATPEVAEYPLENVDRCRDQGLPIPT